MASTWKYLNRGDIVDIIAPASSAPGEKLPMGVEALQRWGLIPRVPEGMIDACDFFAAPLKIQIEQFKAAIYSDSRAIWCLRGGYGSMRLIPYLDKMKPPKHPKLFIGFSDITSLHLYLNQKWNWPTLHGRTLSQMGPEQLNSLDRKNLKDLIFGKKEETMFNNLRPLNDHARSHKTISGKIVGGNLRILQSSLNTTWQLEAKGKILFIEDINERGYSVHRMLEQLHQAGIINKGLRALVIGDFTDGLEKDGRDLAPSALLDFARKVPYPVLSGLPCGHGRQLNYALPFNSPVKIFLGEKAKLHGRVNGSPFLSPLKTKKSS